MCSLLRRRALMGSAFSAEAQAVFDRMPNALNDDWKTKTATFIDALESNGLLSKHDQLLMLGNNDEANSLTDWQGIIDAVNVNSTPHTPYSGSAHAGFAGYAPDGSTKYINKKFNPSVHGTNYVQNSAFEWVFLMTNNDEGVTVSLFGAIESTAPFEGTYNIQRATFSDILSGINNSDNTASGAIEYNSTDLNNQTTYLLYRDAADNQELWEGGTEVASNTTASVALRNLEHYLGGRNLGGLNLPFNCEVVMAGAGGGVINPATLNTLIRDYLTDLGII